MTHLKAGDKAPNFTTTDQDGNKITLKDFKGQKVILYFYPKDNTPTCTTEACNFRDNYKELQKEGFVILGVSPSSAKQHQNFINKFNLPFPLLMDQDLELANLYGVFGPKKFMGKISDAIHRETFIIDEKGKIELVIEKVKSKEASAQILEMLAV